MPLEKLREIQCEKNQWGKKSISKKEREKY